MASIASKGAHRVSTWSTIFRILNERGPLTKNRLWEAISQEQQQRLAEQSQVPKETSGDSASSSSASASASRTQYYATIRSKNHLKQILVSLKDDNKLQTRCVKIPGEVTVLKGHLKGSTFVYEALPKKSSPLSPASPSAAGSKQ